MSDLRIFQMPDQPRQLFLLYHGVGSTPDSLVAVGRRLAEEFGEAAVVGIPGPFHSDGSSGLQWFSVIGINDDNRAPRIATALPLFVASVRDWQQRTGVGPAATALVGFSQGAIMALAATQVEDAQLAGRIVALAGRFGQPPTVAPPATTLHLLHGHDDPVIAAEHARSAVAQLEMLDGDATLDVLPGLGHAVSPALLDRMVDRLKTHVPKHVWHAATQGEPPE